MMKVQFGCGPNKLPGWVNHDAEVDIEKLLPYGDNEVDFILCEHCVEHVPWQSAVSFFKECHRILKRGGVARIIVPTLDAIRLCGDESYFKFTTRFQGKAVPPLPSPQPTVRGAMHAIMYAHGHQMIWTAPLLNCCMFYAGFDVVEHRASGRSEKPELNGVDSHGQRIGERFNAIESCAMEGTK